MGDAFLAPRHALEQAVVQLAPHRVEASRLRRHRSDLPAAVAGTFDLHLAVRPRGAPGVGVDAVQLTVDGQRFPWPRGDGATTTGLLRSYDYPGYAVSSQPDYPVLPARV